MRIETWMTMMTECGFKDQPQPPRKTETDDDEWELVAVVADGIGHVNCYWKCRKQQVNYLEDNS